MKTLRDLLFNNQPRNNIHCVSGCGSYVHVHKENRKTKFSDQAVTDMYADLQNGAYHIYGPGRTETVVTKYASTDKTKVPFGMNDQEDLDAVSNLWNQREEDEGWGQL